MELPDFQKYKDKFTQQGFFDKIQRVAKRAGAKLVYVALILYYLIQSDKVSLKDKAIIIGALGYLSSHRLMLCLMLFLLQDYQTTLVFCFTY